jgi:hypothetical protein
MEKVKIGQGYLKQPFWKIMIGVPLIYLPLILLIPFMIISVFFVRRHLVLMGASNLKRYRDFVPQWISHRYTQKNQITRANAWWFSLCRYKFFWIFNCKLYCPLSVALFEYGSYLVKIVENWWCPFNHEKKSDYANAAIDASFWHITPANKERLNKDDRDNPIWSDKN